MRLRGCRKLYGGLLNCQERGLRLVVFLLLHPNMDQEAATAGFQQEVLIVAKRSELASKAGLNNRLSATLP